MDPEEGRQLTETVALHSVGLLHSAVRDIFHTRVLPLAFRELEDANHEQFALTCNTIDPMTGLLGDMYMTPAGQGIGDLIVVPPQSGQTRQGPPT